MGFKINADKFGFAREPQPDRVSRDYAAELVRKLISEEKSAREANDNILDGYISQEADIRGTEDARLQALIGDINAVLNSHGGSISGLLEQVQAEVQARESKDDALQALINALQAASDKEIEDRTSKDTELDTRITAEAQARETKDTELQSGVDYARTNIHVNSQAIVELMSDLGSEANAREAKDTELQDKITAEASAREAKDAELQTAINTRLEVKTGYHHEINTYYEQGLYLIGIDYKYYEQNHIVKPMNFQPYYLLVTGKYGSVSFAGLPNGVVGCPVQYKFDGNVIKMREVTSVNSDNGTVTWSSWTEYATKTELDAETSARESADTELQTNIDKKQDKVTISEYPEDNSELIYDLSIMHNQELRTKSTLANGITFLIPNDVYPDDYVTSLSFGAGGTAPQIGYTATGIINWVGTDCSVSEGKSIFAPKANTRYDIVIYFNGMQFVGLVNGFVPATIANGGATS